MATSASSGWDQRRVSRVAASFRSTKQATDEHQGDRANQTANADPPPERRGEDDLAASGLVDGIRFPSAAAQVAADPF
jgi:hypothetical protein